MQHEIRSLTGLRGLAALLVVGFHFSFIPTEGHFVRSLFGPCYLAVDLFFLLSGFVMARTYANSFRGGWTFAAHLRFLERRVARVYPLYIVAVLSAFVLTKTHAMQGVPHPTQALASNIVASQNIGLGLLAWDWGSNLNPPTWSISTEAGAYLLFPWLAFVALFRSRRLAVTVAVLAILGLAAVAVLPDAWVSDGGRQGPMDVANGNTLWPFLRCIASFTLGLLIYRVSQHPALRRFAGAGWVDACIIAALAASWFVPGADLVIIALFIALIWQVCGDRSPLARVLGLSLPRRLGEWSYALYLTHFLVGRVLASPVHALLEEQHAPHAWSLSLVLVLSLTFVISWWMYNFVERPARDFLRRYFDLRRSPISQEVAAP